MKKILAHFENQFAGYANEQGAGGCGTCGYGADRLMSSDDFETLLRDIDKFVAENFAPKT